MEVIIKNTKFQLNICKILPAGQKTGTWDVNSTIIKSNRDVFNMFSYRYPNIFNLFITYLDICHAHYITTVIHILLEILFLNRLIDHHFHYSIL